MLSKGGLTSQNKKEEGKVTRELGGSSLEGGGKTEAVFIIARYESE